MNFLQRARWFVNGALWMGSAWFIFELPKNSPYFLMPGIFIYVFWFLTALFGCIDFLNFAEKHWNDKQDIFKS